MKSEVVSGASEILARLDWRTQVVGLDEANFMGPEVIEIAQQLADSGKQVIVAGLDTDYMGARSRPSRNCSPWPSRSRKRSQFVCVAATRLSTRNV